MVGNFKKQVGNRIKSIRQSKGMTQEEFGKLFGASRGNVSLWEKGSSIPNNERLKQLSKVGEMTVDELLYGTFDQHMSYLIDNFINEIKENESLSPATVGSIKRQLETRYLHIDNEPLEYEFNHNREDLKKHFYNYSNKTLEGWRNPNKRLENLIEQLRIDIDDRFLETIFYIVDGSYTTTTADTFLNSYLPEWVPEDFYNELIQLRETNEREFKRMIKKYVKNN